METLLRKVKAGGEFGERSKEGNIIQEQMASLTIELMNLLSLLLLE